MDGEHEVRERGLQGCSGGADQKEGDGQGCTCSVCNDVEKPKKKRRYKRRPLTKEEKQERERRRALERKFFATDIKKGEMKNAVYKRLEELYPRAVVDTILDAYYDALVDAIATGRKVRLPNVGSIQVIPNKITEDPFRVEFAANPLRKKTLLYQRVYAANRIFRHNRLWILKPKEM